MGRGGGAAVRTDPPFLPSFLPCLSTGLVDTNCKEPIVMDYVLYPLLDVVVVVVELSRLSHL